jgi:hypothetical protein
MVFLDAMTEAELVLLSTLVEMGFEPAQATQAIVATGSMSVDLAVTWILNTDDDLSPMLSAGRDSYSDHETLQASTGDDLCPVCGKAFGDVLGLLAHTKAMRGGQCAPRVRSAPPEKAAPAGLVLAHRYTNFS